MNTFDKWCAQAVSKIRYRPDRQAVFEELKAHLEDHYDDLLTRGYSPEKAKLLALEAMGDPDAIAPQLGQIHKPWLGYLLSASKWLLVFSLILATIQLFTFVRVYLGPTYEPDWFYDNPGKPLINAWEDGTGETRRVMDLAPNTCDTSDGFRFTLTRAVLLEGDYFVETDTFQDHNILFFQIDVSSLWQWKELDRIPYREFYAIDSLGNVYNNALHSSEPQINGNLFRTGPFTYTMDLCLNNYCSQDAEWIDICYDRDGRNIQLRIDLTGGGVE